MFKNSYRQFCSHFWKESRSHLWKEPNIKKNLKNSSYKIINLYNEKTNFLKKEKIFLREKNNFLKKEKIFLRENKSLFLKENKILFLEEKNNFVKFNRNIEKEINLLERQNKILEIEIDTY